MTNILWRSPDTWFRAGREIVQFLTISSMKKGPRARYKTTWYKFWQLFKAFIISIILYQFQKDPFCLIILYDIFFYFIHIYIAQWQGDTTLRDKFFFMEAERSYHFDHWLCVSKPIFTVWLYAHCFMTLYVYIALARADNPWVQNFDVNRKASSLWSFVESFKKNLFNLWFYTYLFMI